MPRILGKRFECDPIIPRRRQNEAALNLFKPSCNVVGVCRELVQCSPRVRRQLHEQTVQEETRQTSRGLDLISLPPRLVDLLLRTIWEVIPSYLK
ncbi:hypothetical protein RRG08_038313 [Elysia crispata]|uniref:Uncharacterized protein n=1 Tax=Elysia crispata TaxID=231223 RepID=A0AAE1AN84_9GAST|nr:hypothetical protein RRG08_038313 [Elysia crispata]